MYFSEHFMNEKKKNHGRSVSLILLISVLSSLIVAVSLSFSCLNCPPQNLINGCYQYACRAYWFHIPRYLLRKNQSVLFVQLFQASKEPMTFPICSALPSELTSQLGSEFIFFLCFPGLIYYCSSSVHNCEDRFHIHVYTVWKLILSCIRMTVKIYPFWRLKVKLQGDLL